MRILQVVHGFPPTNRWGAQLYAYGLSKELGEHHEVYVFYPVRNRYAPRYAAGKHDAEGLHLVEIAADQPPVPTLMNPRLVYKNAGIDKGFEALLNEINPDIVHFQHLIGLSASLIDIVKGHDVPAVLTLHDFWFVCPLIHLLRYDYSLCPGPDERGKSCSKCWNKRLARSLAESEQEPVFTRGLSRVAEIALMAVNRSGQFRERNNYMKSLLLSVDKIIAPSDFLRRVFIGCGIPEERIVHSSNGYDLSIFEGFQKKGKEKRNLIFGFAGAVAKHKGVDVLIEAFNIWGSEQAQLRIYGDYEPQSKYFSELRARIGSHNIQFMGRFEDVKAPYSEIDVLVFPSVWYENCPLVLQEAMITNTPVIASNLGAIPEYVVDGQTGLLFEAGNPSHLAEKIGMVADNPEMVSQFAANIPPVKSMRDHATEIERIYEGVLD